jgi:imidazolonepropionase-like amidohydrolase
MKKLFLLACGFTLLNNLSGQTTFPVNGTTNPNHTVYAFVNAKVVTDPDNVIENGTLIIQDGIIKAVGSKIRIPANAVVTDLAGKTIYPGLIETFSSYGITEVKKSSPGTGPQMQSNTKGAYGWNQAVRPETEAVKIFHDDTKSAEELRRLGFVAANTFSKDGIVRGSSAVVSLGEGKENELIISDRASAVYSFDKGSSTQDYPSSLMGAIALLRQTYLDADWYKKDKTKTEYNLSLEAFNNLQHLPQIFEVNDKLNALRADKLGDEFKVQYIIKGSGNEYQRLDEIKATGCKFIIPLNFPAAYDVEDPYDAANVSLTEMKHWEMAPVNPFALEKFYIPYAITTAELKDKKDFYKNLRRAIKYGLTEKQALKALTVTPAEMLKISDRMGTIEAGKIASFIITSGNLFDEKTIIYQNWIQGKPYTVETMSAADLRGSYDLSYGTAKAQLKLAGEPEKLKATISGDTAFTQATLSIQGNLVTLLLSTKDNKSFLRLSGSVDINSKQFTGNGQSNNGNWIEWSAVQTAPHQAETKADSTSVEELRFGDVIYPFTAYGQKIEERNGFDLYWNDFKTRYDAILIKHVTVWTNEADGVLSNRDVYITEGRIVRIADDIGAPKLAFAKVIDGTGKHLTAGIIDEHSHIAVAHGVNEGTQASSAEVRIGDVINSEDINIYRQLSGGVTTAQLLHGSANPIGGQSAIIKLRWGKSPEEMKYAKADGFIKFALGENVKQSNWGDANTIRFPQSRMGVEQVYYDYFTRAAEYNAKLKAFTGLSEKARANAAPFRRDLELEALAEILEDKRFITCHSYVQSEINMLMHVADSMKFRVNTFTHILEGYKVADKMKAHGAGASTFSDWWAYKMEVKDAIPYNAALMHKMGIVTAINSDDAEMGRRLNQEAAKAVKYGGLTEEEALKLVTLNPAKLLHIDNRVGSIKVGKDADLVLWSDHPLSVYAKAEKTIIDGQIYYDNEVDQKLRENIKTERARIIAKMIKEKKGGAETQKPKVKKQKLYECDSMEEDYINSHLITE